MTEERLALSELLEKAGDGDFLRSVAEAVLQLLMETDVERSGERTTWRTATATRCSTRGRVRFICAFLSCGRGATSRRSWRRGRFRRRR